MMMAVLLTITLSGCGSSEKTAPKEKEFIDESQISDLYTTPKSLSTSMLPCLEKYFLLRKQK